jgi:hypothetical protein
MIPLIDDLIQIILSYTDINIYEILSSLYPKISNEKKFRLRMIQNIPNNHLKVVSNIYEKIHLILDDFKNSDIKIDPLYVLSFMLQIESEFKSFKYWEKDRILDIFSHKLNKFIEICMENAKKRAVDFFNDDEDLVNYVDIYEPILGEIYYRAFKQLVKNDPSIYDTTDPVSHICYEKIKPYIFEQIKILEKKKNLNMSS